MSTIAELKTALNGNNLTYVQHAFAKAEGFSIGELLRKMDTNNDKKLSADEITNGIEKYCSKAAKAALTGDGSKWGTVKNFFSSNENTKFTPQIKTQIKKELESSIGKSIDIRKLSSAGINLDYIKVNDVFEALDWLKNVCDAGIVDSTANAYNNFNKGEYKKAIGNGAKALKTYTGKNITSTRFRAKSEKTHKAAAQYVDKFVSEKTYGWVGSIAGLATETVLNVTTGVTAGNVLDWLTNW
ncbi:MAG: hypothetical protein NC408_02795 [Candidatus Gastranaerophilales bacterium]|nr:hypothetical protein [Candidatus Gastranaerophilales bacterium]MCM1072767.1 hypothetical protein [Bacteroides sp.]